MALRAKNGPTLSTRSLKVGDRLEVAAKVENTGAEPGAVSLDVDGLREGEMRFEPATAAVPAKSRTSLTFSWIAALPEGKPALTYRGKLLLRRTGDGKVVGEAPLDVYVSSR